MADPKKRFLIFYSLFLLSLAGVYRVPFLYPIVQDKFLPPMNRYVRFYIIAVLSAVFLFYYLQLYYYKKSGVSVFKRSSLSWFFWASTAAAFLLFCTSKALFSHDLYEYSARARMMALHHINPYLHLPSEIPGDIFFPFLFWKNTPECYGPLWVALGALHTFFFKASLFWTSFMHRAILAVFLALSCAVFRKICLYLRLEDRDILTLALLTNPLVIIMTLFDGHNEIAMVFFMLCALYFLLCAKYIRAFLLLALAINIKFIYLLTAPFFISYALANRQARIASVFYRLAIAGALSLLATIFLWLPFGKESVIAIFKYYRELGQNFWADSIPFAVYFLLDKAGLAVTKQAVAGIFSAAFIILYVYLGYYLYREAKKDRQAIFTAISLVMFGLLFTNSTPFQPWYLVWVIPILFLSGIKSKFLLVFLLSYFLIMTFWKRMSVLAIPMIVFYLILLKAYKSEKKLKFIFSL